MVLCLLHDKQPRIIILENVQFLVLAKMSANSKN